MPPLMASLLGLVAALAFKGWLIIGQHVPFHSDEAVVGLMARHILNGARPVFFYGQAYMGSLDAWLMAGAFRIFGDQVSTIRWVQAGLYLLFLATAWAIARRATGDKIAAAITVWIGAVPPLLISTYTTATLGGYGELLVLGNCLLLLGDDLAARRRQSLLWWLLFGALSGLAFWSMSLIVVYLIPLGAVLLRGMKDQGLRPAGAVLAGFVGGSSPWWIYTLSHTGAVLALLAEGTSVPSTIGLRSLGLVALGLPALLGLRPPWSADLAPLPVQIALIFSYTLALAVLHSAARGGRPAIARPWMYIFPGMGAVFALLFIASPFGIDSTGRYLLPVYLPLAVTVAAAIARAWRWKPAAGAVMLALLLGANIFETVRAASLPSGLTVQFDPISDFNNQHDPQLIEFLADRGEHFGYANYWVSFRLAYLSGERLVYSAELPYKADLSYTPVDNRYPAYREAARRADKVAYITTQHPELDELLRRALRSHEVGFRETAIGPYRVFYDLSSPISPGDLNLPWKDRLP
jgi:hypothetical protein